MEGKLSNLWSTGELIRSTGVYGKFEPCDIWKSLEDITCH